MRLNNAEHGTLKSQQLPHVTLTEQERNPAGSGSIGGSCLTTNTVYLCRAIFITKDLIILFPRVADNQLLRHLPQHKNMRILTRGSPDLPVRDKRRLMKESLDLHAWGLGLIPPGGTKVLDGHSWPASPKPLGSVATRSGTRLSLCIAFMNANKEFYNMRQEVLIFRSTPAATLHWLTFAPHRRFGSAPAGCSVHCMFWNWSELFQMCQTIFIHLPVHETILFGSWCVFSCSQSTPI